MFSVLLHIPDSLSNSKSQDVKYHCKCSTTLTLQTRIHAAILLGSAGHERSSSFSSDLASCGFFVEDGGFMSGMLQDYRISLQRKRWSIFRPTSQLPSTAFVLTPRLLLLSRLCGFQTIYSTLPALWDLLSHSSMAIGLPSSGTEL